MTVADAVIFARILAEDKTLTPLPSAEALNLLDLDGDGLLTVFDLCKLLESLT